MANELPLGQLIDESQQRDAIHVAVAPVIATERLSPGDHIGFVKGDTLHVGRNAAQLLGIVDPFLTTRVLPDERFWMFLYPRTITSLRHEWTHPAFGTARPAKEASEAWLRAFVATADCPAYETVVATAIGEGAEQWDPGEYLHFSGQDAHGDIPPEFWDHIEVVTGRKVPQEKRARYFSCGC